MDNYSQNYYDLLARAFGGDTSSARLQSFIDETLAVKYNAIQIDGFDWKADMQLDFSYEQWSREVGIAPMASYVDIDAPAIPVNEDEFFVNNGKIPRMKDVEYFNEDKVRKLLIYEQAMNAADFQRNARTQLFDTLDRLAQRHTNSLTYQRHQMVSHGGLTLTDENNPRGVVNLEFSANIPAKNKTTLAGNKRWWMDAEYETEGTAADPIADIMDWLKPILDKGVMGHIEVSKTYLRRILGHSKVISGIAASNVLVSALGSSIGDALKYVNDERRAELLATIIGVRIVPVDSRVAVKKWDKAAKGFSTVSMEAFDPDVLVFVPDGSIGEIVSVLPIEFNSSDTTLSSLYDGRLQFKVQADAVKKCQGFYSEMTSLCVPDKSRNMFYLYPNKI